MRWASPFCVMPKHKTKAAAMPGRITGPWTPQPGSVSCEEQGSNLNRPVSADKITGYAPDSPVLPKPPVPRSVAGSSATVSKSAGTT